MLLLIKKFVMEDTKSKHLYKRVKQRDGGERDRAHILRIRAHTYVHTNAHTRTHTHTHTITLTNREKERLRAWILHTQ